MPKSKPETEPTSAPRRPHWLLKLFLLLHVIAITSWALPHPPEKVQNGERKPTFPSEWILSMNERYVKNSPVQLYVLSTGLWQSWDMFSPNPASEDIYSDADVYFKDGTVARYEYPRMYSLGIVEKYIDERYRKFFEHANSEQDLWPFFAKRVALLATKDPNNPPVKVVLKRHWFDIPPPAPFDAYCRDLVAALRSGKVTKQVLLPDNPAIPSRYEQYVYYEYPLSAGGSTHGQ